MMRMDLIQAENYVNRTPGAYWDNYDIVIHKPRASAEFSVKGARHPVTKEWGMVTRVPLNQKGVYEFRA